MPARLWAALDAAGLWERSGNDWFQLDCELRPGSAKATGLLHETLSSGSDFMQAGSCVLLLDT